MDYLFTTKQTEYEVGCGECALVGGVKTTKELIDAGFKMPKVMKDMANGILSTHPGLVHDISLVGYYIGGKIIVYINSMSITINLENAIKLLTLDFPAGYVARLDGFEPVLFPRKESEICFALPRVLKMILGGRQLMENLQEKIENYKRKEPLVRMGVVSQVIVPTFVPIAAQVKKRKTSNDL